MHFEAVPRTEAILYDNLWSFMTSLWLSEHRPETVAKCRKASQSVAKWKLTDYGTSWREPLFQKSSLRSEKTKKQKNTERDIYIYIYARESFRYNLAIWGLCPHEKKHFKIWHFKESLWKPKLFWHPLWSPKCYEIHYFSWFILEKHEIATLYLKDSPAYVYIYI